MGFPAGRSGYPSPERAFDCAGQGERRASPLHQRVWRPLECARPPATQRAPISRFNNDVLSYLDLASPRSRRAQENQARRATGPSSSCPKDRPARHSFHERHGPESATRYSYANRHTAEGLPCSFACPGFVRSNAPMPFKAGCAARTLASDCHCSPMRKSPGGRLMGIRCRGLGKNLCQANLPV